MTTVGFGGVIHWRVHPPGLQCTVVQSANTRARDVHVLRHDVATVADAAMQRGADYGGADAHVGIEHFVARVCQRAYDSLHLLDRALAGVDRLFHVWEDPHVAGTLPERVARHLANLRSLEMLLTGILRRHADRIQVEDVIIARGEPQDCFISTRKAP